MENSPYDTIAGNSSLHFINSGIAPHSIALTQMHADSAPSLPNYVWMSAGQSCGADGSDTAFNRTCPSVFDQMDKKGIDWTTYAEGYPGGTGSCFTGVSSDTASNDYARKHVPPLLFTKTSSGSACTTHVQNFPNDTPADGSPPVNNFKGVHLPALTFVIPNLCHDMHNTASQCGSAQGGQPGGDLWLSKNWDSLLKDAGPTGVVILTWDEGETSTEHIATYIGGGAVAGGKGTQDGHAYDHSSTLRAIEDALGLPCLAGACKATPLPILIPAS
jgi:acid phosphatase